MCSSLQISPLVHCCKEEEGMEECVRCHVNVLGNSVLKNGL